MNERANIDSIEFDGLSFGYEGTPPVFSNISFIMPKSRAVWVRAPGQGRGRSTLLKILAGLLTPQHGRYLINEQDVNAMSFEEFLPYRLNIGYSFDFGGLLNNKTLFENLSLPLLYHKMMEPDDARKRVEDTITHFGLQSVAGSRPFAMTGSQRKLACVIRAFIHWPQVVFLDDPLTGLKQENLNDLLSYVDEAFASRGLKQIFFTSESETLAQKYGAEEMLIFSDWFTKAGVPIAGSDQVMNIVLPAKPRSHRR